MIAAIAIELALLHASPAAAPLENAIATTSSTAVKRRKRRVEPEKELQPLKAVILPTITGEAQPKDPKLDEATLAAFSGALASSAGDVFLWRRFLVAGSEETSSAIAGRRASTACRTEACAHEVAVTINATHAMYSRLTRLRDGSCVAYVSLEDLLDPDRSQILTDSIAPCTADNVLSSALDLGRRIAEGPRAPVRVTLRLTPREMPLLDIPDIGDVEDYATTTSTRARKVPLDRALEIYKSHHMFVFDDESQPDGFYVARDEKLINECDVRRAASVQIPSEILEFCEGNNWEWAWAGFPVGVLIAGLGVGEMNDSGILSFAFGVSIASASALIAVFQNVDAVDVSSGVHYSSRSEIERIVAKSNENLREVLDLTTAEVKVAGMRE